MRIEEVRRCPRSYLNKAAVDGGLRGVIPIRPGRMMNLPNGAEAH
jgi:hypothetical protein